MPIDKTMLNKVTEIARQAGQAIMGLYNGGHLDITYKPNHSPLTQADLRAENIINQALYKLTPNVRVLSEESLNGGSSNTLTAEDEIWIVDPLDGTMDFLKHNDQFTVNIALIHRGIPVLGVVYAPALEVLYYGATGLGAWKQTGHEDPITLTTKHIGHQPPVIVVSLSHFEKATESWLASLGPHKLLHVGSSLKLCYLADGTADAYPRFTPLMEWDIAAADAILRESGGIIVQHNDAGLPVYNKKDLFQPQFIAYASPDTAQALSPGSVG